MSFQLISHPPLQATPFQNESTKSNGLSGTVSAIHIQNTHSWIYALDPITLKMGRVDQWKNFKREFNHRKSLFKEEQGSKVTKAKSRLKLGNTDSILRGFDYKGCGGDAYYLIPIISR